MCIYGLYKVASGFGLTYVRGLVGLFPSNWIKSLTIILSSGHVQPFFRKVLLGWLLVQ